jgi:hypothetical protein
MTRKTDWSDWRERAVAHLAPDERASELDPVSRPPLMPVELIGSLAAGDVQWVLAGSSVFAFYGAAIVPNDLDVVPSTEESNLTTVGRALEDLGAVPVHAPDWRWTLSISECLRWRPLPSVTTNLDHQFVTPYGILDVVPTIAGSFTELMQDAAPTEVGPYPVLLVNPEHVVSRLGTRGKDSRRAMEIDKALDSFRSGRQPTSPW